MTSVFIVRPFGKKPVTVKDKDGKDVSVDVDFNLIGERLIGKALANNQLEGETTEVIAEAGNIRLDMFQRLIAYDLVIADISIENANVFYELGIRHGLRPKGTILIRFPTSGKDVPFDLKTDRYVAYARDDPAAAVGLLSQSIKETLQATRNPERKADSPVFLLLPELSPPALETLTVVPRGFQEAVEKAEHDAKNGVTTLALLGEEAKANFWGREGLRIVGRTQRGRKAFKAARETWEFIRKALPDDVEANLQLATIYQRLEDPITASQACDRVLDDNPLAQRKDRADARSQLARNAKASWIAQFQALATEEARRQTAINDKRLIDAFEGYMAGFAEDLNDYYSGINAFGLLTAIVKLAEKEPRAWAGNFATPKKAASALDDYQEQLDQLRGAVRMSLEFAKQRAGKPDEWLPASDAQYSLLTVDNRDFVRNAYAAARNAGGNSFSIASEGAQVAIFERLGLFPENCRAAFEALGLTAADFVAANPPERPAARDRILVVTGHRADAVGRSPPRFPNTQACIDKAKDWMRKAIAAEKKETAGSISGIGGAASGADLLFLEVCEELGVPITIVLPIPVQDYCRESVADGGPYWIEKFNKLVATHKPIVLSDSPDLPSWAETIKKYGVFQRGNIWAIQYALLSPNADVTLVALWNEKAGGGPGGTADMVKLARAHGAKVVRENTNVLFGLDETRG